MSDLFPSVEHWNLLKSGRQNGGLGLREKAQYHAYDYGWRRVVLNDYAATAPIDPQGEHFDRADVERCEAMWRQQHSAPKPRPRDEAPPPDSSLDDQARFRAQWDELAKLRPAADQEKRAGIDRGPAQLAFVTAASRIIQENMARWAEKQRRAWAPVAAQTLDELRTELGVTAKEAAE